MMRLSGTYLIGIARPLSRSMYGPFAYGCTSPGALPSVGGFLFEWANDTRQIEEGVRPKTNDL